MRASSTLTPYLGYTNLRSSVDRVTEGAAVPAVHRLSSAQQQGLIHIRAMSSW